MSIINRYNEIIDKLMNNDRNATWDEILNEMEECYDDSDIIKYSLLELIEALETAINNSDEETVEFYKVEYLKAKELFENMNHI